MDGGGRKTAPASSDRGGSAIVPLMCMLQHASAKPPRSLDAKAQPGLRLPFLG